MLESSKEYQELVNNVKKSGFLQGDQLTEVYELKGGFISEILIKSMQMTERNGLAARLPGL